MPIPPNTGIGITGEDIFLISPDITPGNINRVKAVYIDLPTGVTLNIVLGPGQDNIYSNGNEAGSIIFRIGIIFTDDIRITVTGPAGTPYSIRIVTEIETPEILSVDVTNFPDNQNVTVTNFPDNQNVTVTNFPDNQNVTVTNFPDNQNVIVTNPSYPAEFGLANLLIAGIAIGAIWLTSRNRGQR